MWGGEDVESEVDGIWDRVYNKIGGWYWVWGDVLYWLNNCIFDKMELVGIVCSMIS